MKFDASEIKKLAKTEEWKYANPEFLLEYHFNEVEVDFTKTDLEKFNLPDLNGGRIVFVNGNYDTKLSHVCKELEVKAKEQIIELSLIDNVIINQPLQIIHVIIADVDNVLAQPRLKLNLGNNSKLIISEHIVTSGNKNGLLNMVADINVSAQADLTIYKQQWLDNIFVIDNTTIQQYENSKTKIVTMSQANWLRNNLNIVINGAGAFADLAGLTLVEGKQLVDNHTFIDHAVPNCESRELYKTILNDQAIGVFNGRVLVRPDAQKTNAFQQNQAVLLSDNATMNAKPELEIYADDVKCSHGATVGELPPDTLFYLQSRGIPKKQAEQILLQGFMAEVVDKIDNETIKNNASTALILYQEKYE